MHCPPEWTTVFDLAAGKAPVAFTLLGLALGALLLPLGGGEAKAQTAPGFTLGSPAFPNGGSIPSRYTCEGADVSPPLVWTGVPASARSLVLIMNDPDAPDPAAPKMIWDHWLIYNLPAKSGKLTEAAAQGPLPPGALAGLNSWKRGDYGGPCPPIGRHRYFFRLYALDVQLPDLNRPNRKALEAAMQGHILATAELMGTYQKQP